MEEKKSVLPMLTAAIALLASIAIFFFGTLDVIEMKGKVAQLETRVAKAEKTADSARTKLEEWRKKRGGMAGGGTAAPMLAPAPLPPPLPPK